MAEYRQNTLLEEIDDEEQSSKSGNTGLPFGLCKRYNILIGKNWTPRDAWNALAGVGVYPPWTEKGKDQYTSNRDTSISKNDLNGEIHITADRKETYDKVRIKITQSGFNEKYVNALLVALENCDDNEIAIFAKTIEEPIFRKGDGVFVSRFGGARKELAVPAGKAKPLDRELGYTTQMTIFFHEYGHYLGKKVSEIEKYPIGSEFNRNFDFNLSAEAQKVFEQDAANLLIFIAQKNNIKLSDNFMQHIPFELENAFYSFANEQSNSKVAQAKEIEAEIFRLKRQIKLTWLREYELRQKYTEEEAIKKAADEKREAKEKIKLLQKKLDNDIIITQARAQHERMCFLSDFMAGATKGKINAFYHGEYGHESSYWRRTKNGVETWAEYVSLKMTKDKKGIEAFKKYLPNTFAFYENKYNDLGGKLK